MAKLIATIRRYRKEKQEYRLYQARKSKLPRDYQLVLKEIEQYLWNFGGGSGMLEMLYSLADLFEEGAREHRDVLSVTGRDVGGFCDELIEQVRDETWTGQRRNKLNESIYKKLGKGGER